MDEGDISQMDENVRKSSEITRICSELISSVILNEINENVKHPFKIQKTLETLCKVLGNLDLLKCRLVSSFWEEESSREFMKRNLWVDLRDLRKGSGSGIKSWNSNPNLISGISEKQFLELCTILAQSENPSVVLKNVEVTTEWDRPTEIPGCSNLLQDFGNSVSRLLMVDVVDSSMLKKYVGFKTSYCQNLEALHFCASASSTDSPPSDPDLLQDIQSVFKLKKILFQSTSRVSSFQERFGLFLIKNSPRLTSLSFKSVSSVTMLCLVKILKELPHVTINLTEMSLTGYVLPLLNELSEMKWSSKLKKVEFWDTSYTTGGFTADPGDRNLSSFLELVARDLEKCIVDENNGNLEFPHFKSPRYLPAMPKIKELWLWNYVVDLEDGPQFLKKFPSLNSLWIHSLGQTVDQFHQFLERCSQAGVIHQNLKDIVFDFVTSDFGEVMHIENAATIRLLQQVFPKLSKVSLGFPETAADASVDEVKEWMEKVFHEIGLMKNTKDLYIRFGPEFGLNPQINESDEMLDLTAAFGNLKELPNLTMVEIVRSNFQFNITELLLKSMIDIPNIKKLEFFGWTLGAEKDKEIEETFAKRNITFQIHDYPNDDDELVIDVNDENEEEGEPV